MNWVTDDKIDKMLSNADPVLFDIIYNYILTIYPKAYIGTCNVGHRGGYRSYDQINITKASHLFIRLYVDMIEILDNDIGGPNKWQISMNDPDCFEKLKQLLC